MFILRDLRVFNILIYLAMRSLKITMFMREIYFALQNWSLLAVYHILKAQFIRIFIPRINSDIRFPKASRQSAISCIPNMMEISAHAAIMMMVISAFISLLFFYILKIRTFFHISKYFRIFFLFLHPHAMPVVPPFHPPPGKRPWDRDRHPADKLIIGGDILFHPYS